MKNHLGDPICRRVGGLAAPAGTNVCISGSAMQKRSTAGLPKAKNSIQDMKKHRKTCPEGAQKRPGAEERCAKFTRGDKNTTEHHNRAAGAPKTQDGPQKKREGTTNDNQSDNTTSDSPDACASQFAKNKDFLHGNTVVSTMFQQNRMGAKCTRIYARSSPPDGGPSSKFYIYIYILYYIYP